MQGLSRAARSILFVLVVWALTIPVPAHAAACCLSAGVFGVGRLAVWEDLVVGTSVGLTRAHGLWAADGRFRAYGDGYQEHEGTAELYGIVRIDERFQAFGRVPWLLTHRSAGSQIELGHGLGDVQAGLRFDPVLIGEYGELPAIGLTATVLAPTGIRPENATTSLATGTGGRGVWALSLALSLEHVSGPWFARLDAGGSVSLPFVRRDLGVRQAYGPGLQVGLFGGRELISNRWVLALGAIHEWEAPYALDGVTVPDSSARSPSLSVSTSWKLSGNWMLQASALATPWVDGLGKNRLGRAGATLGVRYGHF